MWLRFGVAGACALATMVVASPARATWPEPWSDTDPARPPRRMALGDYGFRGAAEYRAQTVYVNPLDLSSEDYYRMFILDQRLRLDGTVDYQDKIRITTSVDALDGVLWGDNGRLGTDPEPANGAHINTNNPDLATLCMTVNPAGGNAVDPRAYRYGLCPASPLEIRRLYADVILPVGLLRVGRQAMTEGAGVALNDGEGRRNRFGITNKGNTADRVLFATKPLEGFKPKELRDISEDRGLFAILAYDQLVIGEPQLPGFNLKEVIAAVRYLEPQVLGFRDVELRGYYAYRWDGHFGTNVHAFGGRAVARWGDWFAGLDAVGILGGTEEVSDAFHLITNDPAVSQPIRQMGARAVVRYDRPMWTAYLEGDYASGSSDTTLKGPLTQFHFAEDTNVGLLLFKQVLAYQTAREAAAATALLNSLGAPTVPVESIATRGAITDALVLFPQADIRPVPDLLLRGGVMFAWAPADVFDPIATAQRRSAGTYQNIVVNYNGGAPGGYYGTEIDTRLSWRYMDHFIFDLEGALLFPGSALKDEDGHAVNSFVTQARTTFTF
jgi:hypothetical protein